MRGQGVRRAASSGDDLLIGGRPVRSRTLPTSRRTPFTARKRSCPCPTPFDSKERRHVVVDEHGTAWDPATRRAPPVVFIPSTSPTVKSRRANRLRVAGPSRARPRHIGVRPEALHGRAERTTARGGSVRSKRQPSPASTRRVHRRSWTPSTSSKRAFMKDARPTVFGERAAARGFTTPNLSHRACGSSVSHCPSAPGKSLGEEEAM